MNKAMRTSSAGLMPLLLVAVAGCKTPSSAQTKDTVPFTVGGVEPKLGDGYDSLVQELRNGASCVSGNTVKLTTGQSSVNLTQNMNSNDLLREFSGEVNGTPRLQFLQLGASGGYFRSLAKQDSVVTMVYAVKIQSGGEQLSGASITADAKALKASSMLQSCGDNYVMQINRGGLLAITLSLDFGSVENRNRWQAKMKFSGPFGDFGNELGNKVSQSAMDGTLTINVNQVGGTPSQALLAVKTCALNSAADFSSCKQRMDELTAYAGGPFAQQVETNPGVLNFITAPLRNLGAQAVGTLPPDILQMRQQLSLWNRENLVYTDAATKSREVGLPLDLQLEADINNNADLIKQAAGACYSYQLPDTMLSTPDWSDCRARYKSLGAALKKLDPNAIALNTLNIAADSAVGNSIFNPYDGKMAVQFAVGTGRSWSFDASHSVGSDGVSANAQGGSAVGTLSTSDKQGALLQRTGQGYARAESSGHLDLAAGEAVGFVLNDIPGHFADNQGLQVIYWRCGNCGTALKKLPTYRLRVKANAEAGTSFSSQENITGTYRIVAYGHWRASPNWAVSDAGGSTKSCGSSCPSKDSPLQVLVMSAGPGTPATAIGRDKTVSIARNSPVYFMMNEQSGGYSDNQGEVELILQCKRCDIGSHPIIINEE